MKWCAGSWLGGFEWPTFVGVDAVAYGKTGSLCWRTIRGCVGGTMRYLSVGQSFSCAVKGAMRWCACAEMEAGYCLLVHARLCSVQRIFPRSKCA